jgi:hypothetical protein
MAFAVYFRWTIWPWPNWPGLSSTEENVAMAGSIKDKAEQAGHKVAEKATEVGHRVGEKVEQAKDWAKEAAHKVGNRVEEAAQKAGHKIQETFGDLGGTAGASAAGIREHIDVYGSCGSRLGRVDHVQGNMIKLTKNDSPDGHHHFIPTSWVANVDNHVHLNKSCAEAAREWKTE